MFPERFSFCVPSLLSFSVFTICGVSNTETSKSSKKVANPETFLMSYFFSIIEMARRRVSTSSRVVPSIKSSSVGASGVSISCLGAAARALAMLLSQSSFMR